MKLARFSVAAFVPFFAVVVFFAPRALAQDLSTEPTESEQEATEGARAVGIIPPRALDTAVRYPTDAGGEALVLLEFVVARDGSVRDVEVIFGEEPFATASVEAARKWSFVPALRGDEPVAVRIQFEVRFEQEQVVEEPSEVTGSDTEPAGQPTAQAARDVHVQVTVEGERPPGAVRFTRAEARQIPGTLGDPFRAVEVMPGVGPVVSGLPFFYVRGAPPANVGNFLDEVRVPYLYHSFLGPSIIHPELLEGVTLHPGPYPPEYGRFSGGAVVGDLRVPRTEFGAGVELGIFDVGGYLETPFAAGRGNVFAAGRYSYTALIASMLTTVTADFWNYQTLISYDVTPKDKVSALVFGASDKAAEEALSSVDFHRVDLRYERAISPATHLRVAATAGWDSTELSEGLVKNQMLGARARLNHQVSPDLMLRFGASTVRDDYDVMIRSNAANFQDISELFRSRAEWALGGYAAAQWRPDARVTLMPSVRVDSYHASGRTQWAVDPSIVGRFHLTNTISTVHGVGAASQPPSYIPGVPGAQVIGVENGLQRSVFTSSGVELQLPAEFQATGSLFYNATFDVTDPFSSTQAFAIDAELAGERSLSKTYGLEVLLRRPLTRRLSALLAYTLSRSTRSYEDFSTIAGSDRTHVLNLAALYTFGANWRLGLRSIYYSGVLGRRAGASRVFDQPRSRPFFRADARLERRFRLGAQSFLSVVAEVQNLTMSDEVLRRRCATGAFDESAPQCTDVVVGPIFLPNLKIEARF